MFLPGESQGWGRIELNTTEATQQQQSYLVALLSNGGYAFANLVCQLLRKAGSNKLQELDGNYRPPLAQGVVGLL